MLFAETGAGMLQRLRIFLLLAVIAIAGSAHADGAASSFTSAFSKSTADQLAVEISLVRDENAKVIIAREPETDESDRELLDKVGFRPATPEEIAAGKATHVGIATHYHDSWRGKKRGAVTGDGRAVLVGDVAIRDARTGRVVGVFDIQAKGIGTGLRPTGIDDDHWHANGKERLKQALVDMMAADYLEKNGVHANQWVAVIDTGIQTVQGRDGKTTEHMALSVRGGNFMRLAHLNYFRSNRPALRELVDYTNRQLSIELGRAQPLSPAGLYRELSRRKAIELADLYWSRVLHGSITYDNIGLFETTDMGTMTPLDRLHPTFQTAEVAVSPGIAKEAENVLSNYYASELKELLVKAFTPSGRKPRGEEASQLRQLKSEDGHAMTEHMFRERMGANALQHLGFDDDDVKAVMKHRRDVVTGPGGLLDTLREIGEQPEPTATYSMGSSEARWRANVKNPARYDLFAGLRNVVAIQTSTDTEDVKIDRLARALEPIGGVTDADRDKARRILARTSPVIDYALSHLVGAPRLAKIELVSDQATRINESIASAIYNSTTSIADHTIERLDRNEPIGRIRAELRTHLRAQVRRGPESAAGVAMRLRRRELERDGAFVKLSAHEENCVVIEEMSDGVHDKIRVTLRGDPLKTTEPARVEMAFTLNSARGGAWPLLRPVRIQGADAIYEIPITENMKGDLARSDFQANFRDTSTDRRFDNYGWSFGRGAKYVLGSPMVDAELAEFAHRSNDTNSIERERAVTPQADAARRAVAARPFVVPKAPPPPKALVLRSLPSDDTTFIRRDLLPTSPATISPAPAPPRPVLRLKPVTLGADGSNARPRTSSAPTKVVSPPAPSPKLPSVVTASRPAPMRPSAPH